MAKASAVEGAPASMPECQTKAIDQAVLRKRLDQEAKGSALDCNGFFARFGKRRHENDGQLMPVLDEVLLELNAAHSRHSHVRDDALHLARTVRG
jgi:hypothetical protein